MVDIGSIALLCVVILAGISLGASLLTLLLIKCLGKWNGYLLLVSSLTVCQAVYDFSLLFSPWYSLMPTRIIYSILSTFGGISATLWSNVIIIVTCRIVLTLHSVEIIKRV